MTARAWLDENLVCPRDRRPLIRDTAALRCDRGDEWPVVEGEPLFLLPEAEPTQPWYWATGPEAHLDVTRGAAAGGVDPYVRTVIVGTCGRLYRGLDDLASYPITELRLPRGDGRLFLELGANWGRWCLSAARLGYRAIGIDPALGAVLAAGRVAAQLELDAAYAVADARHLPLADESVDVVFSFSVLQHLSREDVRACIEETARVLKPGGLSLHQLSNAAGLLSVARAARRGFRPPREFEVRSWSPGSLRREFARIGATSLQADAYFSLNAQASDLPLLEPRYRWLVRASELLRHASERVPPLRLVADSVWVRSVKEAR